MLITTIAHAAPVNGHFTLDSDRGDAAGFGVAVWGGVPSHPGPAVPLSYDGTFAVDSALLGQADGTYSLANYLTAFELKIGGVTFDISNAKSADLYSVAIANHEITGMRLIIESSFMAPNTSSIIFSMTTNGAWAAASTVAQGYTSTTVYGGADHARFYTDYVAAPVPEPETYGMLVSGLGLMGVVARRRKSRA